NTVMDIDVEMKNIYNQCGLYILYIWEELHSADARFLLYFTESFHYYFSVTLSSSTITVCYYLESIVPVFGYGDRFDIADLSSSTCTVSMTVRLSRPRSLT